MTHNAANPDPVPTVQKRTTPPPGILPRNTQAWIIGGVSLVMVLVIAFCGGNDRKEPKATAKAPLPTPVDPSELRIQEYRKRIDEQAKKLAIEQAQLAEAKQAMGATGDARGLMTPGAQSPPVGAPKTRPSDDDYSTAREKSWVELDREKRDYNSLFASNLALSYRERAKAIDVTAANSLSGPPAPPYAYQIPAFMPQPLQAVATPGAATPSTPDASKTDNQVEERQDRAKQDERTPAKERDRELNRSEGKEYRLMEGTIIETVLTNRLDGAFSGPVNCMVTTNVYSHDRRRLLIPQGSRILGEVRRVETFGQQRLAVAFHRLIMPDGYSVSLDKFVGLNQVGETGLRDKVNHHYMQVFGVSLAIGAIAGLSQSNTRYGFDASGADAYRQGVAASLSQSSLRILDRYLNVLPTFTIREGHRVKVYLSDDLLLPAYEKHQMPSDL